LPFIAGSGKSIFWYAISVFSGIARRLALYCNIFEDLKDTMRRFGLALVLYFHFNFNDIEKQSRRACSLPFWSNQVLSLTSSVASFLACIRRTIVARASPATIASYSV
jgi:hypothetical protein